jgi:hypothetical protein
LTLEAITVGADSLAVVTGVLMWTEKEVEGVDVGDEGCNVLLKRVSGYLGG